MPDKPNYITALGFVQFDPQTRDANNKEVTDFLIKLPGGEKTQIRVTVWPENKLDAPIEKGDFVAVDGTFDSKTYQDKEGQNRTSLQINAYSIAVLGKAAARSGREVERSNIPANTTNVPF